jgi:hypothetical protein
MELGWSKFCGIFMKFAFVTNQAKTFFFIEIAKWLQKRGHKVLFLTINLGWKVKLERMGFQTIYLIESTGLNISGLNEFTKNNFRRDRYFNQKGYRAANIFSMKLQNGLYKNSKILAGSIVIGELTWLSELLIWKSQKEMNFIYLMPHSIRFPSDHFAFFLTPQEKEVLKVLPINEKITKSDKLFWENPDKSNFKKKLSLLTQIDIYDFNDPTGRSLVRLLRNKLYSIIKVYKSRKVLNNLLFSRTNEMKNQCTVLKKSKKLFLALHLEPERSVNGFLPHGVSQFDFMCEAINQTNVRDIVVCLHPRQPENIINYKELIKIYPKKSFIFQIGVSRKKISLEDIVATISGSLLGQLDIQVQTLTGNNFFLTKNRKNINLYNDKEFDGLYQNGIKADLTNIKIFSHKGIIGDTYFSESCMSKENISNVGNAFLRINEIKYED